jgi:hypothetical protein
MSTTATLTDEQILGITDDASPADATTATASGFVARGDSSAPGLPTPDGLSPNDERDGFATQNGNSSAAPDSSQAIARAPNPAAPPPAPDWLAQLSAASPAAAPQLADLWQRASSLDAFDRAYYGNDAAAQQALLTQLYAENPGALRAMLTVASQLVNNAPGDDRAQFSSQDASQLASSSRGVSQPRDIPRRGSDAGVQNPPSTPEARANDNAAPAFNPSAYAAFESATNDAVVSDVSRAISRALDRTLPAGIADSARARIAADTLAEIHSTLRGDAQLSSQVAAALRGSRFDRAATEQVARLISARARGVVPEAARCVITEWTGSVIAAHRDRAARQSAGSSRVDILGAHHSSRSAHDRSSLGASPEARRSSPQPSEGGPRAGQGITPSSIDYAPPPTKKSSVGKCFSGAGFQSARFFFMKRMQW